MANIEDVCVGYSLSHVLRCHFLGLVEDYAAEMGQKRYDLGVQQADRLIDFKRVLKARLRLSWLSCTRSSSRAMSFFSLL